MSDYSTTDTSTGTPYTTEQLQALVQHLNRLTAAVQGQVTSAPAVTREPVDNTVGDFDYHSPQSRTLPQKGGVLAQPEGWRGLWTGSYD